MTPTELSTACDHYVLNNPVFSRLQFPNFCIKISKLKLFLPDTSTLGVILTNEGIKVENPKNTFSYDKETNDVILTYFCHQSDSIVPAICRNSMASPKNSKLYPSIRLHLTNPRDY